MSGCDTPKARSSRGYRAASACADFLAEIGIDLANCFGCGGYGCVYGIEPGVVAKVLSVDTFHGVGEVNVAAFLQGLGEAAHPGLPRIFNLYKLDDCLRTQPAVMIDYKGREKPAVQRAFVIVREDVPDLRFDDYDLVYAALDYIETVYSREVRVELPLAQQEDPAPWIVTGYIEPNRDSWSKNDYHIIMGALSLHAWGFKKGMLFNDTHPDNWGGREEDGAIVLRDLGASEGPWGETSETPDSPRLGGLGALPHEGEWLVLRGLHGWDADDDDGAVIDDAAEGEDG